MALPRVSFEARVVADPELRFSPTGVAVGHFRTVSNSKKKNQAGEWVDDKTCWLDVTVFKGLAEGIAEAVQKGDLVVVTGVIHTSEWEDRDGQKRSKTECIADSVAKSVRWAAQPGETEGVRTQAALDRSRQQAQSTAHDDEPPF